MAVDVSEIKDMGVSEVVEMIASFKIEELSGDDRSDAISALNEAFRFITKHTDKDKADDFMARFVDKFQEIKMELETGEETHDDEPEDVESPTADDQAQDRVEEPYVAGDGGGNSFSNLTAAASNFL